MRYAGFWRRFFAYFIDVIIINVLCYIFGALIGILFLQNTKITPEIELYANVLSLFIVWWYYAISESSEWQATLGKRAIGIIVTGANGEKISFGKATVRHFGKLLSVLLLLIGVIMIGITEKKQGLHDKIAQCLVVVKD